MKLIMKNIAGILGLLLGGHAAYAQGTNWRYEATVYLFAPETTQTVTTPAGKLEGTLSFSDALDNLDFAFMGAFGASTGKWSILTDYQFYDLSFENATPGPAFSGLDTDLEMQILNGYVAYRMHEGPSMQVDVAGGFRWFSVDTAMTLASGVLPGRTGQVNDDWIDPVIAVRARVPFSDRWSGTAFFDYGGFSSDSETWQALLTVDYELNQKWLVRGGYRYLSIDHDLEDTTFELSQSGLIFGATYRF